MFGSNPCCSKSAFTCSVLCRNCPSYCQCCQTQPPQRSKCGHGGSSRSGCASITSSNRALAFRRFGRSIKTRTFSPGRVDGMVSLSFFLFPSSSCQTTACPAPFLSNCSMSVMNDCFAPSINGFPPSKMSGVLSLFMYCTRWAGEYKATACHDHLIKYSPYFSIVKIIQI